MIPKKVIIVFLVAVISRVYSQGGKPAGWTPQSSTGFPKGRGLPKMTVLPNLPRSPLENFCTMHERLGKGTGALSDLISGEILMQIKTPAQVRQMAIFPKTANGGTRKWNCLLSFFAKQSATAADLAGAISDFVDGAACNNFVCNSISGPRRIPPPNPMMTMLGAMAMQQAMKPSMGFIKPNNNNFNRPNGGNGMARSNYPSVDFNPFDPFGPFKPNPVAPAKPQQPVHQVPKSAPKMVQSPSNFNKQTQTKQAPRSGGVMIPPPAQAPVPAIPPTQPVQPQQTQQSQGSFWQPFPALQPQQELWPHYPQQFQQTTQQFWPQSYPQGTPVQQHSPVPSPPQQYQPQLPQQHQQQHKTQQPPNLYWPQPQPQASQGPQTPQDPFFSMISGHGPGSNSEMKMFMQHMQSYMQRMGMNGRAVG